MACDPQEPSPVLQAVDLLRRIEEAVRATDTARMRAPRTRSETGALVERVYRLRDEALALRRRT